MDGWMDWFIDGGGCFADGEDRAAKAKEGKWFNCACWERGALEMMNVRMWACEMQMLWESEAARKFGFGEARGFKRGR